MQLYFCSLREQPVQRIPREPAASAQETGAARQHLMGCAGSGLRPVGSRKAQLCAAEATKPGFLLTHILRVFSVASLVSNKANALSG